MRVTTVIIILSIVILVLLCFISYNVECFDTISPSIVENGCYDYLISINPTILETNLPTGITDSQKYEIIKNRKDVLGNFTAMRTAIDTDLDTTYAYMDACVLDDSTIRSLFENTDKITRDSNLKQCIINGQVMTSNAVDQYGTLASTNATVTAKTLLNYIPNFQGTSLYTPIAGNNVTQGCIFDFADSNYSVGSFVNDLDTLNSMKYFSNQYNQNRIDASNTQSIMNLTTSNLRLTSNNVFLHSNVRRLNSEVIVLSNDVTSLSNEVDDFNIKLDDIQNNRILLRKENDFNTGAFVPRSNHGVFHPVSGKVVIEGYKSPLKALVKDVKKAIKTVVKVVEKPIKQVEKQIEKPIEKAKNKKNNFDTKYLTQNDVSCKQNEVLTQFQLKTTNKPPKSAYDYTCAKIDSTEGEPVIMHGNKNTKPSTTDKGRVISLTNQDMNCSESNSFLSKFQLKYDEKKDTMHYEYTCAKFESPTPFKVLDRLKCYNDKTPINTGTDKDGFDYLNRHNVECQNGYAITDVGLKRDDSGKNIYYDYKCCYPKFGWTKDKVLLDAIE